MRHGFLRLTIRRLVVLSGLIGGVACRASAQAAPRYPGLRRAVVVGVSAYDNVPSLQYAAADAKAFAEFLQSTAGGSLDSSRLRLLTDGEATSANVAAAFKWLLAQSTDSGEAVIYFAGHGDAERLVDDQPDLESDGKGFLLLADAPRDGSNYGIGGGAIGVDEIQARVNVLVRRHVRVLLVSDACRSGKLAGTQSGASKTAKDLGAEWFGTVKLVSSGPTQLSQEGAEWGGGHGVFTYYLLRGIQGLAARNMGDTVELGSLGNYVEDNVRRDTRESQVPVRVGDPRTILAMVDSSQRRQLLAEHDMVVAAVASRVRGVPVASLDPAVARELQFFRAAIDSQHLLMPAATSAWAVLERMQAIPKAAGVLTDSRIVLSTALERDAQGVIAGYLAGGNSQPTAQRLRQASDELRHAASIFPEDSAEARAMTAHQSFLDGYASIQDGAYNDALEPLKQALQLEPQGAYAHNALGLAYMGLHRYADAEREFKDAASRAPRWAYPLTELGKLYANEGQFAEAKAQYAAAVAADSTLQTAQAGLGNALVELNGEMAALEPLRRTLAIQRELADTDRAWLGTVLGNLGAIYSDIGEPDSALMFDHQALDVFRAAHDSAGEARVLGYVGTVHRTTGSPDSAMAAYRRALVIWRALNDSLGMASTLDNIGVVHSQLGRRDSALVNYSHALALERALSDTSGLAQTFNNLGIAVARAGRYDSALAYFRQVLSFRRSEGDVSGAASALSSIGAVFTGLAEFDSAFAYLQQAAHAAHDAHDRLTEGATLGSIARAFRSIKQWDSAVTYYKQARTVQQSARDLAGEAGTLTALGVVYRQSGDTGTAIAYYREALPIQERIPDPLGESETLASIGTMFRARRSPDSALAYYRRALAIQRGIHSPFREGATLSSIGDVYADRGILDSALTYLHMASRIQQEVDRSMAVSTLAAIGAAYRRLRDPGSAIAAYDSAATLYESLFRTVKGEANQLAIADATVGVYTGWALSWLAAGRLNDSVKPSDTSGRSTAAFAALAASERGRAQVSRRLSNPNEAALSRPDLAADGRAMSGALARSGAAALVYALNEDTLITWIVTPGDRIQVSAQAISRRRIDELVATLARIFDRSVGSGAIRGGVRAELRAAPEGVQRPVDPASDSNWRAARRELENVLLPPEVTRNLPRTGELVIVPQGSLSLIPFSLLSIDGGTALFGERFSLRYASSLIAAAATSAQDGSTADTGRSRELSRALVVGDPAMPGPFQAGGHRYSFDSLPGSLDEGREVADALRSAEWLTGSRATVIAVRSRLSTASVIHVATNAFTYDSIGQARLSFLAFGPDSAGHSDGHLTTATIVDSVGLHADLVVLSAGRTAAGNVSLSEGVLGLHRAMLAKGARTVVASLWNVDDAATSFLMQRFYQHWLHDPGTPTKSEALRRAQADVRAEAHDSNHPERNAWANPFYWAAFQVYGAQ